MNSRAGADHLAAARIMTQDHPVFNLRDVVLMDVGTASATSRLREQGRSGRFARAFSNRPGQRRTALGYYVMIRAYHNRFGQFYYLAGLETTNDNTSRSIVLHAAMRPGGSVCSDEYQAVLANALRRMQLSTLLRI